jgi:hypothetical protein
MPIGGGMAPPSRRVTARSVAMLHNPDRYTKAFPRRLDAALPFNPAVLASNAPLMLDTTVYVHRLQNKIPRQIHELVDARPIVHCAVAVAEVAITLGLMDPTHETTVIHQTPLLGLLDGIRVMDMRSPSPSIWAEAGMLAGILARTQFGLGRPKGALPPHAVKEQQECRRRLLNDALIFLCAGEHGAVLLSGNVADMDILLRFRPDISVLLYRV